MYHSLFERTVLFLVSSLVDRILGWFPFFLLHHRALVSTLMRISLRTWTTVSPGWKQPLMGHEARVKGQGRKGHLQQA